MTYFPHLTKQFIKKFILSSILLMIITLPINFYLQSMWYRGLEPGRDSFFCDGVGQLPISYNKSKTWQVSQQVTLCGGETTHYIYLSHSSNFFWTKELVFQVNTDMSYDAESLMTWLQWQDDTTLNILFNQRDITKITLQKKSFENIKINYPFLAN